MQSALKGLPGVQNADVSLDKGQAVVKMEQGKVTETQLVEAVQKAGFSAQAN